MKKIVFGLSLVALVAVSCKKLPEGGNKNILKLEDGVERYTDDAQSHSEAEHTAPETPEVEATPADSTEVEQPAH